MVSKQQEKQIEKRLERVSTVWHTFIQAVCIVIGIYAALASAYTGWMITEYINSHTFTPQWPVIFRSPILVGERHFPHKTTLNPPTKDAGHSAIPVITKTEEEIVMASKHGKILWNIYQLETQRGKTDYCRLNHKGYGGFGVKIDPYNIACYSTFEKAVERAEYWLTKNKVDRDLATALCTWNTGIAQPNCWYYQQYLSL